MKGVCEMEMARKCAWCEEHLGGPEHAVAVWREVDPEWVEELYAELGGEG